MWRHITSNALTLLIVLFFLTGGIILWGQREYTNAGPLGEQICLRVERGSNMRAVSRQLESEQAISNGAVFRIGSEYSGSDSKLKAGSWLIPDGASMKDILHRITEGGASTCGTEVLYRIGVTSAQVQVRELDPATTRYVEKVAFDPTDTEVGVPEAYVAVTAQSDTRYRIAVAEGVTSWHIVNALKSVDVLQGEIAEVPPEGSLAPDSYEFSKGDDRSNLISEMSGKHKQWLAKAWETRADGIPLENPYEALILASIIEKETGLAEERRQVASVFSNRLKRGMKLQTDPTVIYGVTKGEGVLGRGLRQSELRKETPYNTYVITGLPPTPIANPGRASLEAAVNPDQTEFIFFVADGTGGHAFAKTLDEHNKNVTKWRAIEAERAAE